MGNEKIQRKKQKSQQDELAEMRATTGLLYQRFIK